MSDRVLGIASAQERALQRSDEATRAAARLRRAREDQRTSLRRAHAAGIAPDVLAPAARLPVGEVRRLTERFTIR